MAKAATGRGLVTTLDASMQRAGLIVTRVHETPLPLGAEIAAANPEFYDPHYGIQAKRIGRLALANWMERMVALRPAILALRLVRERWLKRPESEAPQINCPACGCQNYRDRLKCRGCSELI
jgi:hypothetical protein